MTEEDTFNALRKWNPNEIMAAMDKEFLIFLENPDDEKWSLRYLAVLSKAGWTESEFQNWRWKDSND